MKFENTFQEFEEYIQDLSSREESNNGSLEDIFLLEQFQVSAYKRLNNIFKEEYKNYIQTGLYFFACPFTIYKKTYQNRLQIFILSLKANYNFIDDKISETVFIKNELKEKFEYSPYLFIDSNLKEVIEESFTEKEEFLNNRLAFISNDKLVMSEQKQPEYLQLGSLFAQGFIDKNGRKFNYKDKVTTDYREYCLMLSNEIENIDKVRQYIQATFNDSGEKNIYDSKLKMKKIIDYCNANNLIITDEFNSIYDSLAK